MFSLHETTRRHLCRTAFLLLCVVPTLFTVAWVVWFHRPWRHTDFQQELSRQLHLTVTVGGHECPRPGVVRLSDVQLYDLRWNRHLASIDKLSLRRQAGRWLLDADTVRLQTAQLPALGHALEAWLADEGATPFQLRANQLTLASEVETIELTDIQAGSELADDDLPRLWMQANLHNQEQEKASPLRLVVDRDLENDAPVVRMSIDTQGTALPVWVLSNLVPGGRRYGACRWTGTAQMEHTNKQTRGTLQGTLIGLELQQLIGPNSKHTLAGSATLTLDTLRWRDGRIDLASGHLRADGGRVSRSLLAAAEEQLFCSLTSTAHDKTVPFDALACKFHLSGAGITLEGNAGEQAGCLLAMERRTLLMQPRYAQLPIAQLVRMLSPPSGAWLPATLEAQQLADVLPLPRAEKINTASRPKPHAGGSLRR